ncbi:MAG TPA: LysR substrate-binding domain-containing protein [Hyphomonadaceae bacterium]|nr:LysR substrate-binding domain-containing protein [Hyphomonadaceae bacterium]
MVKPLPPLNAIRAFEAASRHLNLSRAAEELGVTQGAISKQVIALEDFIGVQLFVREPGGLRLTNEGGSLKEAIAPAFSTLSEAFARYSRRSPRSNVVRISTTASFASQFIVPRLQVFRDKFPDIDLEFITTIRLVDLTREEFDIAVRYGPGQWDGVISTPVSEPVLLPVCTPDVFARGGGTLPGLLKTTRRIQCSAYNEWRDWADIEKFDLSNISPAMVIEEFQVALTAALASQGLALLPEILVRDRVRRGELVTFSPARVRTEYNFFIVHTPNAPRRPVVPRVIEWIKTEATAIA